MRHFKPERGGGLIMSLKTGGMSNWADSKESTVSTRWNCPFFLGVMGKCYVAMAEPAVYLHLNFLACTYMYPNRSGRFRCD